jgi:hypothetical protein
LRLVRKENAQLKELLQQEMAARQHLQRENERMRLLMRWAALCRLQGCGLSWIVLAVRAVTATRLDEHKALFRHAN